MSNIEDLRKQRSVLKRKLTTIKNFITKAAKDMDAAPEEVTTRLQAVEETHSRFQFLSQQLLTIGDEPDQKDLEEDTEFDERYFSVKAGLLQLLERLNPRSAGPSVSAGSATSDATVIQVLEQQTTLIQRLAERNDNDALARTMEQQMQLLERLSTRSSVSLREPQVKLPMIKLPSFDGTIEEWKRFSDTFKTLIHDSELSNVQKHQYLVGALNGKAAKVIESIDISEDNYAVAWELLKKRYNDERGIKKRHIQCLFELPQVKRESAAAIQELVDHVQKHLRILEVMKLPTESWSELIIYLIEKNLDNNTRRRWEEYIEQQENVTTNTMMEFLQRHSQLLRRTLDVEVSRPRSGACEKDGASKQRTSIPNNRSKTVLATNTQAGRCYLCEGEHLIYSCKQFLSLSVDDRIREIKRLKLCLNCLRNNHFSRNCRSSSCRECGVRHNTLCHAKKRAPNSAADLTRSPAASSDEVSAGATLCSMTNAETMSAGDCESIGGARSRCIRSGDERKRVLMATAIVNVRSNNNDGQLRVLLDSASEINFISSAACNKLNIKQERIRESISGLNNMSCIINHGCRVTMKSRTSKYELNLYCLVVPKITKLLPSFSIQISRLPIPENIKLADPLFFNPGHIDALVGGEFFLQLLETGKIELSSELPILQNTKFGWIVAGSVPQHLIDGRTTNRQFSVNHICLSTQLLSVDETLTRFWELEEYTENVRLSREEQSCEKYFVNTTTRDSSGRFVVRLPFRENKDQLGRSKEIAIKRLNYLERRFIREPKLRELYIEFMREYIKLKHMSKINEDVGAVNSVYLPHHGVIRESSTTTRLRVVFDASAKTTSGVSLNDTLMIGKISQDNIIDIILRFRLPAIAITADLQKMYRQVLVHDDDRDYQRIVWRDSPSDPISEYRLNTVTYGQASAPFLAIRCVRQLAEDEAAHFSRASQVLLSDLYVDDIITGVDCESDAI